MSPALVAASPQPHLAEVFSASFSNMYVHINPLGGFMKMSVLSQARWDGACDSAFPQSSQRCRCCWPAEHPYILPGFTFQVQIRTCLEVHS